MGATRLASVLGWSDGSAKIGPGGGGEYAVNEHSEAAFGADIVYLN